MDQTTNSTDPLRSEESPGGSAHYRRPGGIQPIEFSEANHLEFLDGSFVKYVLRWPDKNGVTDLEKGRWYANRMILREAPFETRPIRRRLRALVRRWRARKGISMAAFVEANKIHCFEAQALHDYWSWYRTGDLQPLKDAGFWLAARRNTERAALALREAKKRATLDGLVFVPEGFEAFERAQGRTALDADVVDVFIQGRQKAAEQFLVQNVIASEEALSQTNPGPGWRFLRGGEAVVEGDEVFTGVAWVPTNCPGVVVDTRVDSYRRKVLAEQTPADTNESTTWRLLEPHEEVQDGDQYQPAPGVEWRNADWRGPAGSGLYWRRVS